MTHVTCGFVLFNEQGLLVALGFGHFVEITLASVFELICKCLALKPKTSQNPKDQRRVASPIHL